MSDGEPMYQYYHGTAAAEHTRSQVNAIRQSGSKVLSYFIGENKSFTGRRPHEDFKIMYGKDASFIDVTSIPSIVSTLNKLFLVK